MGHEWVELGRQAALFALRPEYLETNSTIIYGLISRWRGIDFILKTASRRPKNGGQRSAFYARYLDYERDDWIPRTSRGTGRRN